MSANERIRRQTEQSITRLRHAGPTAIQRRLDELDAEWDIERVLEANAASAVLIGTGLGRFGESPLVCVAGDRWRHFCCSTPCKAGVRHCPFFGGWVFELRQKSTASDMHSRHCVAISTELAIESGRQRHEWRIRCCVPPRLSFLPICAIINRRCIGRNLFALSTTCYLKSRARGRIAAAGLVAARFRIVDFL